MDHERTCSEPHSNELRHAAPPAAEATPEVESVRGDEVILVVEDTDLVRELVTETLASYGYRVLSASRGEEAVALAERHEGEIDVLLTDVVMPGMNGRELADRLVALHPTLKVLFTSGYPEDMVLRPGVRSGHAFIEKPYLPEELGRAVRRLLAA